MILRMLAIAFLICEALAFDPAPAYAASWQVDGTVVAILGHDTIAVRFPGTYGATTIRLIGVKVPKNDECGHLTMMRALDALSMGKVVTVEFDRNGPLHDAQGRTRAYVWLGETLDEEHTLQEQAGSYAEFICGQIWIPD